MSNSFVLKVQLNDDIRRLSLDAVPSFQELESLVAELFGPTLGKFLLKWTDEDGDLITLSSDSELAEALKLAKNAPSKTLRLSVHRLEQPSVSASQTQTEYQTQSSTAPQVNPFGFLMNNPQLIQSLLPHLPQLLQALTAQTTAANANSNATAAANVDLVGLFRNLGLGGSPSSASASAAGNAQSEAQQPPAMQLQQLIQQLLSTPLVQSLLPMLCQQFAASRPSQAQEASTPSASTEESRAEIHESVQCDNCGKSNFAGIRFKCTVCTDYDLCEQCESKQPPVHDSTHTLMKIVKPVNYASFGGFSVGGGRGCPYTGRPFWGGRGHCAPHGCARTWTHSNSNLNVNSNSNSAKAVPRLLARFVCDVSIEDGTFVDPGQRFVKIWRMRNEGPQAWEENTRLACVGGDKLASVESVPVPAVAPGAEVDIPVDMVAPSRAGRYIGYWRLVSLDGSRFGQRVWVDIVVSPNVATSPSATSTGTSSETPSDVPVTVTPATAPPVAQEQQPVVSTAPIKDPMEVVAPKQVAPAQPVAAEESPEMKQLIDMGFIDRDLNRRLLASNNHDVLKTVQILLSNLHFS